MKNTGVLKPASKLVRLLGLMSHLLEFVLDPMKYLFLVGENECQNESALEKLGTLREISEIVVLSLGTFVSLPLRRNGVAHVPPNHSLLKAKSPALDKHTFEFCREWYESIDKPFLFLTGVPTGRP